MSNLTLSCRRKSAACLKLENSMLIGMFLHCHRSFPADQLISPEHPRQPPAPRPPPMPVSSLHELDTTFVGEELPHLIYLGLTGSMHMYLCVFVRMFVYLEVVGNFLFSTDRLHCSHLQILNNYSTALAS